jgi:GNAT superfamily N-acetyltransferase
LQEFFYSHDEETVRLRYGHQLERMSGESAYKLAAVDPAKDCALGLFVEESGRQVLRAIGRFYLDPGGSTAEVAFVVHQSTRRSGMAGFLLGELAKVARGRGITAFWASVLPENHAMAGLFTRAGGTTGDTAFAEERHFELPVAGILRRHPAFLRHKKIHPVER